VFEIDAFAKGTNAGRKLPGVEALTDKAGGAGPPALPAKRVYL
jgi:hypothetical protein